GYGTLFFHILPFIEQQNLYNLTSITSGGTIADTNNGNNPIPGTPGTYDSRIIGNPVGSNNIKSYVCPSDPSTEWAQTKAGWQSIGSYAGNFQVFGLDSSAPSGNPGTTSNVQSWMGSPRLPASFPDGTSNTILIAEKYGGCAT